MSKIYNSIDELVGNTPLMELKNIENYFGLKSKIFAKLEYFNPVGSIKDRVALCMINEAEKSGKINKDTVIIEPTSGNTGIGLSAICASRGYKIIIVMPENMSNERKLLMKAFGAQLYLTDANQGMSGAIKKAEELSKEISNSIIAGQFINPANPKAHYDTTGPEIFNDLCGKIDFLVAGVGTGGTITGTAKYLKEKINNIKVVGVEPKTSAVLSGEPAGKHGLQGIGAGFIPKILDVDVIDEISKVSDNDAYDIGRLIAKKEGLLVGISSGAALFSAIELGKKFENEGKNIVVILPDSGERYLSTAMFNENE
ncbi:MAG: cysteine synthase A [Clostridia bacterium]|nr:cysteine synthase A [Clostridia bacterium]